jgi:hypothetical protein
VFLVSRAGFPVRVERPKISRYLNSQSDNNAQHPHAADRAGARRLMGSVRRELGHAVVPVHLGRRLDLDQDICYATKVGAHRRIEDDGRRRNTDD